MSVPKRASEKGFRNLRKPLCLRKLRGLDLNQRPSGYEPDFETFRRSLIRGLIPPNILIPLRFYDSIWFDSFHRFRSFSICFISNLSHQKPSGCPSIVGRPGECPRLYGNGSKLIETGLACCPSQVALKDMSYGRQATPFTAGRRVSGVLRGVKGHPPPKRFSAARHRGRPIAPQPSLRCTKTEGIICPSTTKNGEKRWNRI